MNLQNPLWKPLSKKTWYSVTAVNEEKEKNTGNLDLTKEKDRQIGLPDCSTMLQNLNFTSSNMLFCRKLVFFLKVFFQFHLLKNYLTFSSFDLLPAASKAGHLFFYFPLTLYNLRNCEDDNFEKKRNQQTK